MVLLLSGEFHGDTGAFAEGALEMDVAAEEVDIALDDVEAEAGAFDVESVAAAKEAGEQMLLVLA